MFDVGFFELAIILVVALLVVGPDRLPGLARTVGLWVGKARYYVSAVKAEVDREIRNDEIKRQTGIDSLEKMLGESLDLDGPKPDYLVKSPDSESSKTAESAQPAQSPKPTTTQPKKPATDDPS